MGWFMPDAKWLDIVKVPTGPLTAFAMAGALGWYAFDQSVWPHIDPVILVSIRLVCAILAIVCGSMVAIKLVQFLWGKVLNFIQPIRHRRDVVKHLEREIPLLTPDEREILGHLLHTNRRVFTNDSDGGRAVTLMAKKFIRQVATGTEVVRLDNIPFAVPIEIWNELMKRKDEFPRPHPDRNAPWRDTGW